MSRSCSVQLVLQDPEARVKSIKPSGDCFYEAVAAAFSSVKEDVRDYEDVFVEDDDDQAMALRRTAAMAVNEEVFQNFSMYHVAGLKDFSFMKKCENVSDLRDRLLVSGSGAGAGQCLWANEFEINAVCAALRIVCLIIDHQAKETGNRFVRVGELGEEEIMNNRKERFVILQRSRREHYDLVVSQGEETLGLFTKDELPDSARKLWQL